MRDIFGWIHVTRTTGSYRFLADVRRLNVALSRAKNKIIIVGDIEYAVGNELLSKIMERCVVKKANCLTLEK